GARYFASTMGRFMTPDWAEKPTTVPYASFGDPQSLNLYSYVENGPINRIDADGHVGRGDYACENYRRCEGPAAGTSCDNTVDTCDTGDPTHDYLLLVAQNNDPNAPPPPPTPDPAGVRTDPTLHPSNSNSSTTNTPADQTQAPLES